MNINLDKSRIKIIKIEDKNYPEKLKNIYNPPKVLYVLGNEKILNETTIAIVGSRDCTKYGAQNAYKFAYEISKRNIGVISGFARGIDAYAHKGALLEKGKTIAVLGCGLDIIYPSENFELYKKIVQVGGAIITEYPLGTKPEKYHFPERNRIISGLAEKILVIEAKERSGALITVDYALEQGKDVYAIPGNITNINSIGTNEIIKEGAFLVTNIQDIVW